ncbi:NAD-dependent epimerase/dehydratase family protein [Micromonospora sp. NPDC048063]|uniref:NAD-dependent epimerase/dehydratase family protein n=1 Tax=Micromonospora sp. NPDC048063 TaxID=3364256 RepID=UPI0037243A61
MSITKFAVAGATGRLGRRVVDVLVERGHQVVSMSRVSTDPATGNAFTKLRDVP